jgi:hypothetical protein
MVAAAQGFVILPRSTTAFYRRPDVSITPIVDIAPSRVVLIWDAAASVGAREDFLKLALACAAQTIWGSPPGLRQTSAVISQGVEQPPVKALSSACVTSPAVSQPEVEVLHDWYWTRVSRLWERLMDYGEVDNELLRARPDGASKIV